MATLWLAERYKHACIVYTEGDIQNIHSHAHSADIIHGRGGGGIDL
jgi:hypothetical protein